MTDGDGWCVMNDPQSLTRRVAGTYIWNLSPSLPPESLSPTTNSLRYLSAESLSLMVQAAPYLSDHTNRGTVVLASAGQYQLTLVWMGHAIGQARLNPLPRITKDEPLACACMTIRLRTGSTVGCTQASYNSTLAHVHIFMNT